VALACVMRTRRTGRDGTAPYVRYLVKVESPTAMLRRVNLHIGIPVRPK